MITMQDTQRNFWSIYGSKYNFCFFCKRPQGDGFRTALLRMCMCLIGQVDSKETGQGQGEEQGDSWMWLGGAGEGVTLLR